MKQVAEKKEETIIAANHDLFLVANHPTGSMLTGIMRKALLQLPAVLMGSHSSTTNQRKGRTIAAVCITFSIIFQSASRADTFGSGANSFTIDFVAVGNAGNAPDGGGYGGVPYQYRVGKFEISLEQINKATASGLMGVAGGGSAGNRPAVGISWYEAAAFVNWLNTSTGRQAAYNLVFTNGAWSIQLWSSENAWQLGGENLYRHKDAVYFLPSENEWYKAAYYAGSGAFYYTYPTASYTPPVPVLSGTSAGTAVYNQANLQGPAAVNNAGGLSHYGTMGQGGNVYEWLETAFDKTNSSASESRAIRGGYWFDTASILSSSVRGLNNPTSEQIDTGFRVASMVEPPVITSSTTASGTVDTAFAYNITASNTPLSYAATGLPAGLSINTTSGTISGTPTEAGTFSVTVSATNSGGSGSATLALTIGSASQTIAAFATVPTKTFETTPFVVTVPAATSGLPVVLSVKSGPATVGGNTVTLTGVGTVVLAANQVGNANYTAAPEVTTSFAVTQASQTIAAFAMVPSKTFGDAPFTVTVPAATSGLAVVLSVKSGPATVGGNTVTLTGVGTVVLAANQVGNANYTAAPEVTTSFAVTQASQTIAAFATVPTKTFGTTPFAVTVPAATSGLPVVLSVKSGPATVSANTVTLTGVGTVVLAANQVGNTNYAAAPEVTTSFDVTTLEGAATKSPFDPATAANWSAGGTEWSVDTSVTYDGVDSVKAQTSDGQSTYREYTVTGPAVVDFWWKVSSERNFDKFSYSLNGVNQETISGEVDWTYRTLTLPTGTHTIRWTYSKDDSGAIGQDAGWLDDLAVYPATATLQVSDGSTVLGETATVDFGSADVGTVGFTKILTFVNNGYVPLEVQLALPEGSPFAFDAWASTYDLFLGRGESVDVPIRLATITAGTKSAQLSISAPDSTVTPPTITLIGYVRGPDIGLAQGATTLTSGQTFDMGLTPRTVEFTIRNNGNVGDLVISTISATGNFQITQQPSMTIPPQTSTTFKVLAQNVTSGLQSGSVSIASNAGDLATFSLPLTSKSLTSVTEGIADGSMATSGTGGATAWDFAATTLPSGQSGQALKTGSAPNNGESVLEFTTQAAGVVSWSWKVSTQEDFDWLLCEVDGQEAAGISTKSGVWQTQVLNVPAGANVRWIYRKDASGSIGEDAGYLTNVEFRSFAANQPFAQWGQTHGIYDPQQRLPKSGLKAMFAWLGGFDPAVGTSSLDLHHDVFLQPDGMFLSLLLYRFSHSKTADGTQQILYSSDMSSWTTRRISQRIVSEDADRVVIEAIAPSGTKGFFKVVGGGDTLPLDMLSVMGGLLPPSSELSGLLVPQFSIGKQEVTLDIWQEIRDWAVASGYDLAGVGQGSGPDHPVHSVSWYDAVKWCNARSEREGLTPVYRVGGAVYRTGESAPTIDYNANGYRLPPEAWWEWAARGGLSSQGYTYSGSNDVDSVAWSSENSNGTTEVAGAKASNELGLYDMSGNVWEWCEDFIYGSDRVVRGGSWNSTAIFCTVSRRGDGYNPSLRHTFVGFRVVRGFDNGRFQLR